MSFQIPIMPSKLTNNTSYFTNYNGTKYVHSRYYNASSSTLKSDGSIDMAAQNPHNFMSDSVASYSAKTVWSDPGGAYTAVQPRLPPGFDVDKIEQIALAKFNGKLKKGNASMGITLGTWGQSAGMITTRLGQASRALTKVHSRLVKDRRRLRKIRKEKDPLANLVLETEFGWRPLISDIHSAFRVIAGVNDFPVFVRGSHTGDCSYSKGFSVAANNIFEGKEYTSSYSGHYRVTIAARVAVSNPNLHLLNQLGLINPFLVAWDLIPWSFVVGMFVNVNAMLGSLTDYAGLRITNKSVTKSSVTTHSTSLRHFVGYGGPNRTYVAFGHGSYKNRYRTRSVGSIPAVKLQVRIPDLNKEQLLIAASLVLQKFAKINKLIAI